MRSSKNPDRCRFNCCTKDAVLFYYGRGLCVNHWNIIAQMPTEQAKAKLGIKAKEEPKHESDHLHTV